MSFGRPYILNVDGCIHDGWLVISPRNNALYKDYFYYLLSSDYAYQQFSEQASGAVVSNLNKDKVADALIPLPSVSEQKRIVDAVEKWLSILDLIDDGQSKLYELADNAKEKVLNLAIHGKLVAQDPSDEPAIELLKRINPAFQPSHNLHYGADVPTKWQLCHIQDIASVELGKTLDRLKNSGEEKPYCVRSMLNGMLSIYLLSKLFVLHLPKKNDTPFNLEICLFVKAVMSAAPQYGRRTGKYTTRMHFIASGSNLMISAQYSFSMFYDITKSAES